MDRDNNYKKYNNNNGNDLSKSRNVGNEWDQLSYKLGKDTTDFEDEDDFFQEINSSLAKQISKEMEGKATNTRAATTHTKASTRKKKRLPKGLKIFAVAFSIIMVIFGFLMFTSPGRKILLNIAGKYIYTHLDYQPSEDVAPVSGGDTTEVVKETPKPMKDVVNILLIGVEEIGGASNTDVMIIASMNT
jgi:hypothetical protein